MLFLSFAGLFIAGLFIFKVSDYNTMGFMTIRDQVVANYTETLFKNQRVRQLLLLLCCGSSETNRVEPVRTGPHFHKFLIDFRDWRLGILLWYFTYYLSNEWFLNSKDIGLGHLFSVRTPYLKCAKIGPHLFIFFRYMRTCHLGEHTISLETHVEQLKGVLFISPVQLLSHSLLGDKFSQKLDWQSPLPSRN